MEAILETIPRNAHTICYGKQVDDPCFLTPYHFHPEIEILLVQEGYGTLYVGDGMRPFVAGDVAIIGSNIPHWWTNHEDFTKPDSTLRSRAICIQFPLDGFGARFLEADEARSLRRLFVRSNRGIFFTGSTREQLGHILPQFMAAAGLPRLARLLDILDLMHRTKDFEYLSTADYQSRPLRQEDSDRLDKVFRFVDRNYGEPIELQQVAQLLNLSAPSFCRYFKSRTNKVFSQFLNEVRIGKACDLLMNSDLQVAEIGFRCGYNHLSNFNRQFKRIKGLTPRAFRKRFILA